MNKKLLSWWINARRNEWTSARWCKDTCVVEWINVGMNELKHEWIIVKELNEWMNNWIVFLNVLWSDKIWADILILLKFQVWRHKQMHQHGQYLRWKYTLIVALLQSRLQAFSLRLRLKLSALVSGSLKLHLAPKSRTHFSTYRRKQLQP